MEFTTDSDEGLLRQLRARLQAAGCFERRGAALPLYVAGWTALFAALFVALLHTDGIRWWLCALAAGLAKWQLSTLGHDGGHHALSRRRAINHTIGRFGMTLVGGISFSHWRRTHSAHHAEVQREGADPDMEFAFILAMYRRAPSARTALGRLLIPFQIWYFWVLALLYPMKLRIEGFLAGVARPTRSTVDTVLFGAHLALWLVLPALFIGPLAAALAYVLATAVAGVIATAVFSPNHVGMPTLPAGPVPGFVRLQVEGSRNVRVPRPWQFLFCGLNFQIEHHLFPTLARGKLRAAREIVRPACLERGLPYAELGFGGAIAAVMRHLAGVGRGVRAPAAAPSASTQDQAAPEALQEPAS